MSHLISHIATQIVTDALLGGRDSNNKAGFFLSVLAALLLLVAAAFLIVAMHYWLSSLYAPQIANLVCAAIVFVFAFACTLCAWGVNARHKARSKVFTADMQENLKSILLTFDDNVSDSVRQSPLTSLVIAGLAGWGLAGTRH